MEDSSKKRFLEAIESVSPEELEIFFQEFGYSKKLTDFNGLWFNEFIPHSYWILIINGLNDKVDRELANTLLNWSEFKGKSQVRIRCIQASDQDRFDFCNNYFDNASYPVLFISNYFDFKSNIKINGQTLIQLHSKENEFEKFLVKIHTLLKRNKELKYIQKELNKESFWNLFKIGVKEVKSLFTITINN